MIPFYSPELKKGIKDTFGNIVVPPIFGEQIMISNHGIIEMIKDTAFIYDRQGTLRFSTKAHEITQLKNGVVAIKLFGHWGLKDSTGKQLVPYKYQKIEELGNFIICGKDVFTYSGEKIKLLNDPYNFALYKHGWYGLYYLHHIGKEIRDENFNVMIDVTAFYDVSFFGNRLLKIKKNYDDHKFIYYDKEKRKLSNLKIEMLLTEDAYLLYANSNSNRKILKRCVFRAYSASDSGHIVPLIFMMFTAQN